MIKVSGVTKSFDSFRALDDLNLHVGRGSIYGLVGTNGSGKTTIIKHITGVLRQDDGEITVDGQPVYDNEGLKARMGYIPDDLYFFASYNLKEMGKFYSKLYPNWNEERFQEMVSRFGLEKGRKISKFSKGMQKQVAFSLTMSTMPDFLILDEPIDGLDPIVRKLVWKYVVDDVAERQMTVLVSSHNLKEMEDICDSIGILSKGHMVLEKELDDLRGDVHKVQVAFDGDKDALYSQLNILHKESRGTVDLLIVKNKREELEEKINAVNPVIFDVLPLTLEEIFMYELGGTNDEFKDILF